MLFTTLLLKAAEEQPPPLIDMDGTILVQLGFFLLLWIVLWKFLFQPFLKVRDDRAHGIEGSRKAAAEMEATARDAVKKYDEAFNRAKLRGAEERQKLRGEAAAHERQVLGAAREEAQRSLGTARAKISDDSAKARQQLDTQASVIAKQVASRILGREVA
jgi:F-type H+-transporting ATPase subunit b